MRTVQDIRVRMLALGIAGLCLSLAAACGGGGDVVAGNVSPGNTPSLASTPRPGPAPAAHDNGVSPDEREGGAQFEGTAGVVEKRRPGAAPALLRAVRTAAHDGFDRIVFEFEGATLPGYHLEYVDRPVRACGSGDVVPVAGDGWLRVQLTPAHAHTEAGEPTVKDRARRLDLPNLKELKIICDFEAEVAWVLGLASPTRYRVLELANPSRLVVDVRHDRS